MKLITFIVVISLFFITGSCDFPNTQVGTPLPKDFDYGKIRGNRYYQKYLAIEMTFDTTWAVQSKADIERITKANEAALSEDAELKAILEVADIQTANLFAAFKHELDTPLDYNPSIILIVENLTESPSIKTGADYHVHSKKILSQLSLDNEIDETSYKKKIGGKYFDGLKMYSRTDTGTFLIQEYFAFIKRDFCVLFIITYHNDEEKEELYSFLDNIRL